MVSSYCWKLKSLLKKNLILMKRNFLSTLFEILFPIILMVVIIGLREAFPVEIYKFSEEEVYKYAVQLCGALQYLHTAFPPAVLNTLFSTTVVTRIRMAVIMPIAAPWPNSKRLKALSYRRYCRRCLR